MDVSQRRAFWLAWGCSEFPRPTPKRSSLRGSYTPHPAFRILWPPTGYTLQETRVWPTHLKCVSGREETGKRVQSEMNVRKCSTEWKRKPHTGPGFLKYLNHWGPAERTWPMKSPGIWLLLPPQGDKEIVEEKDVPFPYHRGLIGDWISNHVHTLLL